ncbi:hypothetical protein HYH03_017401 [Edaphochlamys debaryana]|uniref:Uncharacterized protein n=1 Tax=Edaphochlamys debaryana TaxID=47281 RepID=A0A836BNY0_9CHLO|nr:hypothetical protein HYH03_017401 [Edaphochlamys debaryana]|eukprot:KAG2483746.1 hypothetical protein HYH03_017401 [Edaphochlamys debaryana]
MLAKALFLKKDGKDQGLGKCARVDSLGLAKRRLAAKHAEEELAKLEQAGAAPTQAAEQENQDLDHDAEPAGVDSAVEDAADSDASGVPTPLASRHLNDSIRLTRERFHKRASLDAFAAAAQQQQQPSRASGRRPSAPYPWSSVSTPRGPGGREDDDGDLAGGGAGGGDDGEEGEAGLHVRFRRASDGEALSERGRRKSLEGTKGALKRLFRRITANLPDAPNLRVRSAAPSRSGSPTRYPRGSSPAPGGGTWGHRRSSEVRGDDSPPTQSQRTSRGRRSRSSAPGELLFGPGEGPDAAGLSPPIAAGRAGSTVTREHSAGKKGESWLAKFSRGFSASTGITLGSSPFLHSPPPSAAAPSRQRSGGALLTEASPTPAAPSATALPPPPMAVVTAISTAPPAAAAADVQVELGALGFPSRAPQASLPPTLSTVISVDPPHLSPAASAVSGSSAAAVEPRPSGGAAAPPPLAAVAEAAELVVPAAEVAAAEQAPAAVDIDAAAAAAAPWGRLPPIEGAAVVSAATGAGEASGAAPSSEPPAAETQASGAQGGAKLDEAAEPAPAEELTEARVHI